jgi:outer membrane protein assembly factor BamB
LYRFYFIGGIEKVVKPFALLLAVALLLSFCTLDQVNSSAFIGTPTILWQTNLNFPTGTQDDSRSWTAPTVLDGVLYVGAVTNIDAAPIPNYHPFPGYQWDSWSDFYAFNASNGELIWDYKDDSAYKITSCAVKNGVVFFGALSDNTAFTNQTTYVSALNASSGALLKTYNLQGEPTASPILVSDLVLFSGGSYNGGCILTLNSSSLDLFWEYTVDAWAYNPVVANGFVYFYVTASMSGTYGPLYALDVNNGNEIWSAPNCERLLNADPKIVNGILYSGYYFNFPERYGLNAFDASNGNLIWNYTTNGFVTQPIVGNGVVYFVADKIYALNALTGVSLWNYSAAGGLPTFNNGIIYIDSMGPDGMLALRASDGAKLWNYSRANAVPPLVIDGVVYANINGSLGALDANNGNKIWSSNLPVGSMQRYPSINPTIINDALYVSGGNIFYAVNLSPTVPTATSTATFPTTNPTSSDSNSQTPQPTPTAPELSWLVIPPLLISVLAVALVLRYRKFNKPFIANSSQRLLMGGLSRSFSVSIIVFLICFSAITPSLQSAKGYYVHSYSKSFTITPGGSNSDVAYMELQAGDHLVGSVMISNLGPYQNYFTKSPSYFWIHASLSEPQSGESIFDLANYPTESSSLVRSFDYTVKNGGLYGLYFDSGDEGGVMHYPSNPALTLQFNIVEANPLKVQVLSPLAQTYRESNISLSYTANRAISAISYSFDASNSITLNGNTTLAGLSIGMHNVTVSATDNWGYKDSETVNFTVEETQAGTFDNGYSVWIIAVAVAAVCIVAGLLLYRRHHIKKN